MVVGIARQKLHIGFGECAILDSALERAREGKLALHRTFTISPRQINTRKRMESE
jgi:hypothetical protein